MCEVCSTLSATLPSIPRPGAVSARVKSAIVAKYPRAQVYAEQGVVVAHVEGSLSGDLAILREIQSLAADVEGVRELRANVSPRFGGIGRFC